MPRKRPLRVYLDNSDLSNLFKGHSEEFRLIRDELFKFKEDGVANYYFSFWHVVEFIQKPPPGYREEHREKAKFLHNLCENNVLPHHMDVIEGHPISDRPIWLPHSAVSKISADIAKFFGEAVDERPGLNRKQRRTLKSSRVSRRLFSKVYGLERFSTDLPLSEKFVEERTLTKFVRGEIDHEEFKKRLAELFCTPPIFYDQWYNKSENSSLLSDLSKELGQNLVSMLDKAIETIPKMQSLRREMLARRKAAYDIRRRIKQETGLNLPLDEEKLSVPSFDISQLINDPKVPPRLNYLKHYLFHAIKLNRYKQNDAIDLLHLFYTPDVDLMRCDKSMYSIMKSCSDFDTGKLVRTLPELPERIRQVHTEINS